MKCEVTALLAPSTLWNSCPQRFHKHVGLFVLIFWFSIRRMDDEGLLLPSEIRALKASVSWFQRLISFVRFFSPSLLSSLFPSSHSLFLMCLFLLQLFSFSCLFSLPCNKSKWLFFSYHGPLDCMRLELRNRTNAFHCEEKLVKGNFEIKIKRADHFSFLKFYHFQVGLICGCACVLYGWGHGCSQQ